MWSDSNILHDRSTIVKLERYLIDQGYTDTSGNPDIDAWAEDSDYQSLNGEWHDADGNPVAIWSCLFSALEAANELDDLDAPGPALPPCTTLYEYVQRRQRNRDPIDKDLRDLIVHIKREADKSWDACSDARVRGDELTAAAENGKATRACAILGDQSGLSMIIRGYGDEPR